MKSSPFYAHQFAIPNYEIKRLSEMFLDYNDKNFNLDKFNNNIHKDQILRNSKINLNKYCIIHNKYFYF